MHPCVAFYKKDGVLVRHSLVFVSDDTTHDHHAVHHYTVGSVDALLKVRKEVETIYLFSDGCSSQYKGRGTFADLSLYKGMFHPFTTLTVFDVLSPPSFHLNLLHLMFSFFPHILYSKVASLFHTCIYLLFVTRGEDPTALLWKWAREGWGRWRDWCDKPGCWSAHCIRWEWNSVIFYFNLCMLLMSDI